MEDIDVMIKQRKKHLDSVHERDKWEWEYELLFFYGED